MKRTGLKLLTVVLLLMHLIAPAQAAMMGMGDASGGTAASHCLQHDATEPAVSSFAHTPDHSLQHPPEHQYDMQHHSGADCCQQHQACEAGHCSQCQPCAAVAMLVNLHRQAVMPALSALLLAPVTDSPKGIATQNLYRPPIDLL